MLKNTFLVSALQCSGQEHRNVKFCLVQLCPAAITSLAQHVLLTVVVNYIPRLVFQLRQFVTIKSPIGKAVPESDRQLSLRNKPG